MQVLGHDVPVKFEIEISNKTLETVAYMIDRVAEDHPGVSAKEIAEMVRQMIRTPVG